MSRLAFENIWVGYFGCLMKANCPLCDRLILMDHHINTEFSWNRSHIISVANGGPDSLINIMVLCVKCNQEMSKDDLFDFLVKKNYCTKEEANNLRNIHLRKIHEYDPICEGLTKDNKKCLNRKILLTFQYCKLHLPKVDDMLID